jgi:hypothetical protein
MTTTAEISLLIQIDHRVSTRVRSSLAFVRLCMTFINSLGWLTPPEAFNNNLRRVALRARRWRRFLFTYIDNYFLFRLCKNFM